MTLLHGKSAEKHFNGEIHVLVLLLLRLLPMFYWTMWEAFRGRKMCLGGHGGQKPLRPMGPGPQFVTLCVSWAGLRLFLEVFNIYVCTIKVPFTYLCRDNERNNESELIEQILFFNGNSEFFLDVVTLTKFQKMILSSSFLIRRGMNGVSIVCRNIITPVE